MKKFSFEINGGNYEVNVISNEGGFAQVEVNGTPYNVKINGMESSAPVAAPAQSATAAPAPQPAAAPSSGDVRTVKSPLPGSIVKIIAHEGTAVKEGDVLLVMESMKMENNIVAEFSGTVRKIYVAVSQTVMQDDLLVDIG